MSKTIAFETELTGGPTLSIPPEIAAALPSKGKVTSNYILVETIALLQHRLGLEAVWAFHADIPPLINVEFVASGTHQSGAAALLSASRRDLSLVDCVSFEVMRTAGISTVFAFDKHFQEQGFAILPWLPPHIHVAHAGRYAKFWLEPATLADVRGFHDYELTHHNTALMNVGGSFQAQEENAPRWGAEEAVGIDQAPILVLMPGSISEKTLHSLRAYPV